MTSQSNLHLRLKNLTLVIYLDEAVRDHSRRNEIESLFKTNCDRSMKTTHVFFYEILFGKSSA